MFCFYTIVILLVIVQNTELKYFHHHFWLGRACLIRPICCQVRH